MRMNRGTILLLLVSLVVIIAVLVLTINQAAAPGADDEPVDDAGATPVALFDILDTQAINRLEIRDDMTGDRLVLVRSSEGGPWALESADMVEGDIDQAQADGLLESLVGLEAQDSFEAEDLSEFGLDQPAYSIYTVADDGLIQVLHIGDLNPAGTRYYTTFEQLAPGTSRPDLDLMQPLLERMDIDTSVDEDDVPGTEEAVMMATVADADAEAEATASLDPTLAALADAMANAETEAEATELAATYSAIVQATNAADAPDVRDTTAEAMATEDTDGVNAEDELEPIGERAEVDTSVTTLEPDTVSSIDPTPLADVTVEAEVTLEPLSEPLVNLEGPMTVSLVNIGTIRTLIGAIDQPPVVTPLEAATATPPAIVPDDLTPELGVEDALADLEATEPAMVDAEATAAP